MGENFLDVKRRILDWVGRCTVNCPGIEVKGLTDSFNDGKVRKTVEKEYIACHLHLNIDKQIVGLGTFVFFPDNVIHTCLFTPSYIP